MQGVAFRPSSRGLLAPLRAWLAERLPRQDTQLLTHGNVYILPTRAGWMYALTLVVLLVASINYQLNLGFVLTFLLAGSGVVSMHVTHATLRGLTLHLKPPAAAFAGEPAGLEIVLQNPGQLRHGIGLSFEGAPATTAAWVDVPALGSASAHVSFVPEARGWRTVPVIAVETRFPLGLFRAWTLWRPAASLIVYPSLETPAPPLPPAQSIAGGPVSSRTSDGGEVEGVRAYRRGDPPKLVAWKKAAQALETGAELVSRDTSVAARRELRLEWSTTGGGLAAEQRLSRLAAWVVAAHRAGIAYAISLPGSDVPSGDGDAQRKSALETLALWTPS